MKFIVQMLPDILCQVVILEKGVWGEEWRSRRQETRKGEVEVNSEVQQQSWVQGWGKKPDQAQQEGSRQSRGKLIAYAGTLQSWVPLALPWHGRNLSSLFLTCLACLPVTAMTRLIPFTSWRSLMMARSSIAPVCRRCLQSQQKTGKRISCSLGTEIGKPAKTSLKSSSLSPIPIASILYRP